MSESSSLSALMSRALLMLANTGRAVRSGPREQDLGSDSSEGAVQDPECQADGPNPSLSM